MSSKHSGSEEGHQLSRQDSVIRSGILQANFLEVFELKFRFKYIHN